MSGIAGVYLKPSIEDVERMIKKITHRGPDDQGIKNLPNGTLGHTRLAILDLVDGRQPMGIDNTWIVFNGAIYNYRELANEHLRGESLKTHSDTEVILHLYKKFGARCVKLLDGAFALAILDRNGLFLARDPLGIKPMYCSDRDGAFYFASEIKALAELSHTIYEFPAGYWFHSQTGWHPYFGVDILSNEVERGSVGIESIPKMLKETVRKRLQADVPVGVWLSGGLEKSIIALLAKQEKTELHSFSAGPEGSEDLAAARKIAEKLGTVHHERIYIEQEILAALAKVIYHLESFDPALVRPAISNFFLAEVASKFVKVILTSEGADEIYSGYDYFDAFQSPEGLQEEMIALTGDLHNTTLQRLDRISMAFGLEPRLPFLDIKSLSLGFALSPQEKIHRDRPAKHLLRQAFSSELPKNIPNRPKQRFPRDTRAYDCIVDIAEREISDAEFQSEGARLMNRWDYRLSSKEALYYYKMLRQSYEDRWIFPSMGRRQRL